MSEEEEAVDLGDIGRRMEGAITALQTEMNGLRTGRAHTGLLDPIMVEVYGQTMPIAQVGTVSAPEARLITVQVWDKGQVTLVEKAIRESDLGLNPAIDGNLIRIALPELNAERREELAKIAGRYAEQARIAVRNVRRDGMERAKKAEKDSEISQDEAKDIAAEVQEMTDDRIKQIDDMLAAKENDIRHV